MKLNRNTKKGKGFIDAYSSVLNPTLAYCYKNYSQTKARAEEFCNEKMLQMGGWGFNIFSFNYQTFTCGWLYEDKEREVTMLNVETAYNSYQIEFLEH